MKEKYSIEDFNGEMNNLIMQTFIGSPRDFSILREICTQLQENHNYDFKTSADDETFWKACRQFNMELVRNS